MGILLVSMNVFGLVSSEVILLGWSEVSVGFTYRTVGLKVVGVFIKWFVC